jgi:hypothetical protein
VRARNLAGLLTLSPEAAALARPRLELEGKALAAVRSVIVRARPAKGKGGVTLLFVNVQGEPSRQKAPGSKCPACEGLGRWRLRPRPSRWGRFRPCAADFQTAMQETGWMGERAGLWLPPGLPELTVRGRRRRRGRWRGRAIAVAAGACPGCEDV